MSESRQLKLTIGFAGGQVLPVRASAAAVEAFNAALAGPGGWHELPLEDGAVRLDLRQVAYVRVDSDEPRVGFGA